MSAVSPEPPAQTDPGIPHTARGAGAAARAADTASARWWRWSWLFSAVWLVYLAYPVAEALRYPGLWARAAALAGLALFAATFVGTFLRARIRDGDTSASVAEPLAGAALMGALLAAVSPVVGEDIIGAMMYIVVLAVMLLPSRRGWSVAAGVIVLAAVLTHTVPGWESQDLFVAQLALGAVAGWGVGQLIARNRELQTARETIADLAVVAERDRLARDLHDILGHSLSVIAIKAELAGRLLEQSVAAETGGGRTVARVRAEVDDIESLARRSLADVRRTVAQMRSVTLEGELAAAHTALSAAGIEADLPSDACCVSPDHRELFAWVLREGVTNVVRHSGAGRCLVTLDEHRIRIEDDGTVQSAGRDGGHGAVGSSGTGLAGLRQRAGAAGAVLRAGRGTLGGMRLEVEMP